MTSVRSILREAANGPGAGLDFGDVVRRGRRSRRRRMAVKAGAVVVAALVIVPLLGDEAGLLVETKPPAEAPAVDDIEATVTDAGSSTPPSSVPSADRGPRPVVTSPSVTIGPVSVNPPTPPLVYSPPTGDASVVFIRDEELYVMREDGTGLRQLTEDADSKQDVAWSPDGTKLAVSVAVHSESFNPQVWVLDLRTGTRNKVTNLGRVSARGPQWSPDGRHIVYWTSHEFASGSPGHMPEVWRIDPDGGNPVKLATGSSPTWSPEGSQLVYSCSGALCLLGRDGTGATSVPASSGLIGPAWSPDGRWIAAVDSDGRLAVIRPDGTDRHTVGSHFVGAAEPAWVGRDRLVYKRELRCISPCANEYGLWSMKTDGSDPRRLTDMIADTHPAARPRR